MNRYTISLLVLSAALIGCSDDGATNTTVTAPDAFSADIGVLSDTGAPAPDAAAPDTAAPTQDVSTLPDTLPGLDTATTADTATTGDTSAEDTAGGTDIADPDATPPANNCGEITYEGCCNDGFLKFCDDGVLKGGDCKDKGCGWNAEESYYDCEQTGAEPSGAHPIDCAGECVTLCDGKECGNDGCGGVCGTCEDGKGCNAALKCAPKDVDPGACCTAQSFAGCGNEELQACVCAVDAYCCDTQWDQACVNLLLTTGCAICPDECVPQCDGKQCGDDGCGNSCGECETNSLCNAEGQCEQCVPQCEGKQCGPDACGGVCGDCTDAQECTDQGQCVDVCVPACDGKTCGSDGCGDVCGTCADGETCKEGNCVVAPKCPDECGVFVTGAECQCDTFCFFLGDCCDTICDTCKEDYPDQCCEPKCDGFQCGDDGCGGTCGSCDTGFICSEQQVCEEAPPCVPACDSKVCGDDGCGGTCGECGEKESCDANGACQLTSPPLSGTWVSSYNLKTPTGTFKSCQQILNMSDIGAPETLCDGCNYAWKALLIPISNNCGDWAPENEEDSFSVGINTETNTPYFDFGEGWGQFAGTGTLDGTVYKGEFYTGFTYYVDMNGNGQYDAGEELSLGFQFVLNW